MTVTGSVKYSWRSFPSIGVCCHWECDGCVTRSVTGLSLGVCHWRVCAVTGSVSCHGVWRVCRQYCTPWGFLWHQTHTGRQPSHWLAWTGRDIDVKGKPSPVMRVLSLWVTRIVRTGCGGDNTFRHNFPPLPSSAACGLALFRQEGFWTALFSWWLIIQFG